MAEAASVSLAGLFSVAVFSRHFLAVSLAVAAFWQRPYPLSP
jgi:hypothetical protein